MLRRVDEEEGGRSSSSSTNQYRLDSNVADLAEDGPYERIGLCFFELENSKPRDYVKENGVDCEVKLI